MKNQIYISLEANCAVDACDINFEYFGTDKSYKEIITGDEWIALSVDQQQYYILEDLFQTFKDSDQQDISYMDMTGYKYEDN